MNITQATPTQITLSGLALQYCYAALLSEIRFLNSADEPGLTNRSVYFSITDDSNFTSTAASFVRIIPTNDPTIFSFENRSLTFNEATRAPIYLLMPGDTLVDSDDNALQWVVFEISPALDESDEISLDPATTELTINSEGSKLNISGYASFSIYEVALTNVTFRNSYLGLSLETRVVQVVTFDGETESPPTEITITIVPFDDAPVCYFRNTPVSGTLTYIPLL